MSHLSYHIHHLYLHQKIDVPPLETSQSGHYLVFWWKEIPLGHLYVDQQQVLDQQQYIEKLSAAIAPALRQYAGEAVDTKDWKQLLLQQNLAAWNQWMTSILSDWTAEQMPATVPVSVVICTRNRANALQQCLQSLNRMRCQPAEIVIIDNAPSDSSTREVVKRFAGVQYFVEPLPGLSFARNTGLQKAIQPIIAFTDDDVLVHSDWVYRVWKSFEDSNTAAMTGLVLASELKTETQLIFEQHWSFNRGYADITFDSHFFKKTLSIGPPVWDIGAGANMAFRRDIFQEVGLFDERLGAGASGCSEDSEMWYRILTKGYTIRYNPRAVVYHEHRSSLEALHKQLFSYMKGFAVAVLIQQEQQPQARYKKHLFGVLPKYYLKLARQGFPRYRFRFRTVGTEIRGLIAGFIFYLKHRNTPAQGRATLEKEAQP